MFEKIKSIVNKKGSLSFIIVMILIIVVLLIAISIIGKVKNFV